MPQESLDAFELIGKQFAPQRPEVRENDIQLSSRRQLSLGDLEFCDNHFAGSGLCVDGLPFHCIHELSQPLLP